MLVLAQSVKGKEFIYNPKTAHAVSKRSAEKIKRIVNGAKYKLKDDVVWFLHEISRCDTAYVYAERQSFFVRHDKQGRLYVREKITNGR